MKISGYSSLHSHTHYSTLDAINTPEELVIAAKEKNLKSVAISDHGVMHGHLEFMLAGKKHGVKVVYGMEGYFIHSLSEWNDLKTKVNNDKKARGKKEENTEELSEEDVGKDNAKLLRNKGHLVLLAQNRTGLSNLYNISFKAFKEGFYGKPRADKQILIDNVTGIIGTTACMGGVISKKCWLFKDNLIEWKDVVNEAKHYDEIFGRGQFYLELQFSETDSQRFINECMVKIHNETGIPLTVTTDSHYVKPNDWKTQELIYLLRSNKTISTKGDDWHFDHHGLYVKSPDEMWQWYKQYGGDLPENLAIQAFENTLVIDSMIDNFDIDTTIRLPTLKIENPMQEIVNRALKELKNRGLDNNEVYVNRLLHECRVIKKKGFANYFLITQQIVSKAKERMLTSPARGSAAGSLLCYLLGITDLDPIQHKLFFERFLDEDRPDLPDIDMDFQDPNIAKDLLRETFGEDNVGCVSNYSTFKEKSLLKDICRVHDFNHFEIEKINKRIEAELLCLKTPEGGMPSNIDFDVLEKSSETLRNFLIENPSVRELFVSLHGRIRNIGRHAGGVVIGDNLPRELPCFVVEDKELKKRIVQVSYTEGIANKNLSTAGFVKFDILGLENLNVIDHAIKLVSKKLNKTYDEIYQSIRPHNIDLNDLNVLKHVFWEGNYCGIFQYTEKGIQKLAKNVKPDCFEDIAALGAIYRPGPLGSGMDSLYTQNKHNKDKIKYAHPMLENILKNTYGALIYQEQVLQIGNQLGKLSMGETNKLRKVLTKKAKGASEEAEKFKERFVKGCIENNMVEKDAVELWDMLAKFAAYGFNLCVLFSQPIHTYSINDEKTTKQICEVKEGDFIESRDESSGKTIKTKVIKLHDNGIQDVFEFKLDNGETVSCTMDHKFRTTSGEMLPMREIIKMNLEIVSGAKEQM